ncbi:uncharacterized protein LOC6552285 [Drosophila erecta]|uniref:GG11477 n=1 Tax=Drosophila erecta TaxID=7220 RepID=B3P225_DROER|nr:uncharacterized protein LOC6552285 [Drosophila erecta]EDV47798.1 uncharacterized protein Dere_GG11477 [Drosophila erecta]
MGARNSKPQTVQIENPTAFEITRDVVDRINQANAISTELGCTHCESCKQKPIKEPGSDIPSTMEHKQHKYRALHPVPVAKSWKKRSFEVEEKEFGKSLKLVQELFGSPVKWAKDCQGEIGKFEEELVHCYQRFPNEPLQCANLARQYHRFVFAKQYAELSKTKTGT